MVEATCWTLIEEAAAGVVAAREALATRSLPLVRAALAARWAGGALAEDVDDAVQEVFVECLRDGGVLERVGAARPQGFRSFLYGVVRNVARRHEERRALRLDAPRTTTFHGDRLPLDETSFEEAFDREWARDLRRRPRSASHARPTPRTRAASFSPLSSGDPFPAWISDGVRSHAPSHHALSRRRSSITKPNGSSHAVGTTPRRTAALDASRMES